VCSFPIGKKGGDAECASDLFGAGREARARAKRKPRFLLVRGAFQRIIRNFCRQLSSMSSISIASITVNPCLLAIDKATDEEEIPGWLCHAA
jgi:hypothetical protein